MCRTHGRVCPSQASTDIFQWTLPLVNLFRSYQIAVIDRMYYANKWRWEETPTSNGKWACIIIVSLLTYRAKIYEHPDACPSCCSRWAVPPWTHPVGRWGAGDGAETHLISVLPLLSFPFHSWYSHEHYLVYFGFIFPILLAEPITCIQIVEVKKEVGHVKEVLNTLYSSPQQALAYSV